MIYLLITLSHFHIVLFIPQQNQIIFYFILALILLVKNVFSLLEKWSFLYFLFFVFSLIIKCSILMLYTLFYFDVQMTLHCDIFL